MGHNEIHRRALFFMHGLDLEKKGVVERNMAGT